MCMTNKSKFCVELLSSLRPIKNKIKFLVVDILFPDHVGLPHVLDLAVHLVYLSTWMGLGVILRIFPY